MDNEKTVQGCLEVYPLKLQEGCTDYGFLIHGYKHGTEIVTAVQAFLIKGAEMPILVDTGIGESRISRLQRIVLQVSR